MSDLSGDEGAVIQSLEADPWLVWSSLVGSGPNQPE